MPRSQAISARISSPPYHTEYSYHAVCVQSRTDKFELITRRKKAFGIVGRSYMCADTGNNGRLIKWKTLNRNEWNAFFLYSTYFVCSSCPFIEGFLYSSCGSRLLAIVVSCVHFSCYPYEIIIFALYKRHNRNTRASAMKSRPIPEECSHFLSGTSGPPVRIGIEPLSGGSSVEWMCADFTEVGAHLLGNTAAAEVRTTYNKLSASFGD